MRYLLEHFTGIFLIFSLLHYDSSYSRTNSYATHLNSSEEIKNIFNLPNVKNSVLKGAPGTGNFAEGGIINENSTQSLTRTVIKNFHKNFTAQANLTGKQSMKPFLYNSETKNTSHNFFESSMLKTLPRTKLNETSSNLYLGAPEVIHVNGTSSIKPRKGVQYINIVPHKKVENENYFSGNKSCFWLSENKCYDAKALESLKCNCCKESNMLGKTIEQQASENCKNCRPVNLLPKNKDICKNICCSPIAHDMYSLLTTKNIYNNNLNHQTVSSTEKNNKTETASVFFKKIITEVQDVFASPKKNSKLKPSVTKVPYDVEVVTNLLSNTQQKVFIPIIVSLFLLPLIGVIIFFLWRRAKEYWDKRYYKRMDFLIDGIYND